MRTIITIGFCVLALLVQAQNGSVHVAEGGLYFHGENTYISMEAMNVQNNGVFEADSATNFYLSGDNTMRIEGTKPIFGNVFLDGNMDLQTAIELQDITLQAGILEMNDNDITLKGSIWEERNESFIFSNSTGEIVKTLDLEAGQSYNPGNVGFTFKVPEFSIQDFEIRRGHVPQQFEDLISVSRYFKTNNEFEFGEVAFQYLDHEYTGTAERFQRVFYQNFSDKIWESSELIKTDTVQNISQSIVQEDAYFFTLFDRVVVESMFIPEILTLNNDGINDVLRIAGLENYPNNKITIFNRWGDVVFQAQPYQNNWNGTASTAAFFNANRILPVGTYFVLFQPDASKEDAIKEYLEITH